MLDQRTTILTIALLLTTTCLFCGCGAGEETAMRPTEKAGDMADVSPGSLPLIDTMPTAPDPIAPRIPMPSGSGAEPPKPVAIEMQPYSLDRQPVRAISPQPRLVAPSAPRSVETPEMVAPLMLERQPLDVAPRMISQPPMAPRSSDTAAHEPISGAMAMESAVARAPIAEDRGEYEAVTVFYGTDRGSSALSGLPARPHLIWLYAAGVCVALCGLFAALAMYGARKKAFGSLAVMCFSAGSVMAVMGTIAWLQSDGAVAGPKLAYGNERGTLVMGTCEVSIPRDHEVAQLEAPSVFKLDFVEDPTKHVVLLDVEERDSEAFFSKLRSRVDMGPRKEAFVFVHGFNVTFKDAARRTAQLAYDLKFQGAPIFYSWPSQGGLFQYAVDETNVVWTVPHLREFLSDVAEQSGAESIHLIAHSMGNRALTGALRELSFERQDAPPLFNEVVLTAPDIDAEIFRRDIAPAIVTTARRVTLYASSNDGALMASKKVHGYPRAGDSGENLVVIPGVQTVDVSAVDTSLLGHNYYGDNATVIADMIDLVQHSKSPTERIWLETARLDDLLYWVFRKDRPQIGANPTSGAVRY